MNIYLSNSLSANRKGRFLQNVVHAKPLSNDWRSVPPTKGLLLVQSEELIELNDWQLLYDWAMQSECSALVIITNVIAAKILNEVKPPLDWQLTSVSSVEGATGIAALLSTEISQAITGFAGSADNGQHQIGELVHTRYIRKHSNSGLFSLTTLPLWSLNLLDHGEELVAWFRWFTDHAGIASEVDRQPIEHSNFKPQQQDMIVLLLVHAAEGLTIQDIAEHSVVKMLFDIESLDISNRGLALQQHGFIYENALTENGLNYLQDSSYWAYAEQLAEQLNSEAHQ